MTALKAIAPIAGGIFGGPLGAMAGSALSALGGSGKQGGQNSNSTTNSTQTTDQSSSMNQSQSIDQMNKAIEDPEFAAYRQALIPLYSQEYDKAQQPVYGSAQKADYLGQLNDLAQGSIQSLKGNLAGRGALGSGAFNANLGNIESNRYGQAAQFFGQLPMMEEQRRAGATKDLLQMGMNFAGRAPISQQITGTNNTTGNSTMKGTTTGQSQTTGQTSQQGPGFMQGFANNLGGLAGGSYADWQNNQNNSPSNVTGASSSASGSFIKNPPPLNVMF